MGLQCKYCNKEKPVEIVFYLLGGVEYACLDCISKPENLICVTPIGLYYKDLSIYK